jgi:hypothetical protein
MNVGKDSVVYHLLEKTNQPMIVFSLFKHIFFPQVYLIKSMFIMFQNRTGTNSSKFMSWKLPFKIIQKQILQCFSEKDLLISGIFGSITFAIFQDDSKSS